MVIGSRSTVLATALMLVGAVRVGAQDKAVHVFTYGGGYSALKNLDDIGAELKTGLTLGGGIGYEIDKYLELRASLTGAQSQLLDNGAMTGVYLNRYYLAADLKARYRFANGFTPYGLVGTGAVLLHEKGTTGADKRQGFAHLGLGIGHAVGKSGFTIFAQGDGFFYSLSGMTSPSFTPFSKVQTDVGWSVGASYRFAL
ncbi:MAG TPA: outer membrane beta-barrel protein [Gemmatimonadales bacterium]|nr:outer membrane beta-barrel protein [Gemmatimonadales bacterium]